MFEININQPDKEPTPIVPDTWDEVIPEVSIDKPIKEMDVKEIEQYLIHADSLIEKNEELYDKVALEIEVLRKKLAELEGTRREIRDEIGQLKQDKLTAAQWKEHLLREALKNKAIEETADKVFEIMREFPGWEKARDYQREDVVSAIHAYLSGFNGFLNANDMGLGKTMESFLILKCIQVLFHAEHGREPQVLWLTKSSILKTGGTVREGKRWMPDFRMMPVEGSMPKKDREAIFELVREFGFAVITNYETCRTTAALADIDWDIIVMDEVHKLKGGANLSGPTGIWKSVFEITRKAKMMIMLSGTPMVNRVGEMWAYLHIFDPERFPSLRSFENAYTMTQKIGYEYKIVVDGQKLLDSALRGRMVRRRKDEVGLQMPEITPPEDRERLLEMLPQQREVYNQMRDQFFVWLEDQGDKVLSATAIIAQLIRLRQINIWPVIDFKTPMMDEFGVPQVDEVTKKMMVIINKLDVKESSKIDEAIDIISQTDEPVVVFCTFNEPLKEIQRRINDVGLNCQLLTGENSKNLANLETDFQDGKIDVLCINSAMGEGLNLHMDHEKWSGGSRCVIFLDLWYNPARNDQCTDRVYRPGATKAVSVYHLKNESSVDQWLDAIIEEKRNMIEGVTEDKKLRPGEWAAYLKKLL
jgi:SNF2 family DNA or RNA helicase